MSGITAPVRSAAAERLLRVAGRRSPSIAPRTTSDAPLSPAQRGVWVADALEGGGTYNLAHLVGLRGALDVAALRRALGGLVRRHEILRTRFAGPDGELPRQVVVDDAECAVEFADLRGLPVERRSSEALRLAEVDAGRPFDPTVAPLLRALVVRVDEDEHLLVLCLHHLLADEWAVGVLAEEISAGYAGETRAALPIQYGDYAQWQSDRLADGLAQRQLGYWREALRGVPYSLDLPTDQPRPVRPSRRGGRARLVLDGEAARGVRRLAAEHGVTAFTAMTSAFALVLRRYADQPRFVVGTVVSGRSRVETEPLVGLFANAVAIPVDVSDELRVDELLRATHHAVLGALDHQDVPLDRVLTEIDAPRSRSRSPLFQVSVQWSEDGEAGWRLPGLTAEPVALPYGSAKTDLCLVGTGTADGIELELVYEADLFLPSTAERLVDHVRNALAAMVADPGQPVVDVELMGEAERHLVTREWVGAVGAYPRDKSVPEVFADVVARQPDAPAITSGDVTLTYAELDARTSRLAHVLRRRGVTTDRRVGLALPRSLELVVSLLAVYKAGGAALALDPANPPARNALLASDADVSLVVGDGQSALRLDDPAVVAELASAPSTPPVSAAFAQSLAHVCYTSGSTGKPKGVGLTHRAIVRLALGHHPDAYGPGETAVLLAPVAFDVSLMEIFGALLNGGRLVVPPPGRLDIPDIAVLTRDYRVTTLGLVTALFHQLVEHDMTRLATVGHLLIGGDSIRSDAFDAVLRAYPGIRVIACYGPTENTTITTSIEFAGADRTAGRVPIGRPIPHSRAFVLDDRKRPVPIGVIGELYAGGDGLARGYVGCPGATADRFVPDALSGVPGGRLYRTGDLVRWRSDGVLDFVGRVDGQVKIRGFRIEVGEVEARICAHPRVAQASVVVWDDGSGHKRLVAYVVSVGELSAVAVKGFVAETLPEYMVPAAVVFMPVLPLNANGKVDRARLPEPVLESAAESGVEPRSDVEATLLDVWSTVLGVSGVGVFDNFFDLGGDSILSIRVASEARARGLTVSSADIFDHQTIAELAVAVADRAASPVAPVPVAGDAPLTPIQRWYAASPYAGGLFTQSVRLAWAESPEPSALRAALQALVDHHDALRLRLSSDRQSVAPAEAAELLEILDVTGDAEATVLAAATRLQHSVDPVAGPLLRALLVSGLPGGDQLILVVHHLAVDTVSWGILLDDLVTAYRGRSLPATTTPYPHWARTLAEHAESPGFADEAAWWQSYTDNEVQRLPVDRVGGDNSVGAAASVATTLSARATEALLRTVPVAYGARLHDVLLTALARTLHGWTGSDTHLVDVERHGREPVTPDVDVTRTVGWFTSVHPVRLALPASRRHGDCVAAVRDHLRSIPRHGLGYGLARYLRSDWPGRPDAEVLFNYHGQVASTGDDGLLRRLALDSGPEIDPDATRPYLLEVTALVRDGALRVVWTYPPSSYDEKTVTRLAEDFTSHLAAIAWSAGGPRA